MPTPNTVKNQKGFVLIFSLVILLIITTIGTSLIQTGTIEEKMAAATRNKDIAFQAAEAALAAAEAQLALATPNDADFKADCTKGLCIPAQTGLANWERAIAWTNATTFTSANIITTVAKQPQYIIEHLKSVGGNNIMMTNYGENVTENPLKYYRITARGYGATEDARVLLQTTYAKE
ncbi:MAG: pilus assembly protein [Marinagarivorans sp.]|nr:pilus assembly protein [Marinagarivorans sp.]